MTLGTLRDQVTYPDNAEEQHKKGITDKDLEEFLKQASCQKIVVFIVCARKLMLTVDMVLQITLHIFIFSCS